ncbi:UNVERIFIED_CONTAM: hypothetical protein Sangu_2837600 [Sesamum angustifolium]|uniref:Transposase MuDR plant domain-containing protein n=1 Tax=Sesamum angustifolium TaxID=2727405 RepID=A0AAW2IQB4_9LAMI
MALMPIIRPASLVSEGVPDYGKYDFLISVRIYHGGNLIFHPSAEYRGGMESVFDFVDKDTFTLLILDKCCEELGYLDGHGKEIRIYLDAVRCPKFVAENQGDYELNVMEKNTVTDGDKGKNTVTEEESGDGERADWIDWDRDDEDMRENEEWVADSEDDLYDGDESVDYNEDDEFFMRIQKNSDEDNVAKAPVFCPDDTFDPRFALGMKFSHKKEFRGAVHSHAIMTRRNLAIRKMTKEGFMQDIREYNHVHNCGASFNVKNVRINWLSQRYVEAFKSDPNRSVKGFRQDVIRQIRCNVSRGQAYKTKRRCLQEIQGDGAEQYSRMWDYAGALRNKNPAVKKEFLSGKKLVIFHPCLRVLGGKGGGHNTKGSKWKKFADEFLVDDVFELAAETEQHETAPIQQDEVIVNEDCPLISQPEEVSAPEADVS